GLFGGPAPGPVGGGCSSCGGGGGNGCVDGCGCVNCYPGRYPCDCCCDPSNHFLATLYGIYQCVCCPDPCYEGRWCALANASLFLDPVRPVTQMRLRADFGWNLGFPDKGELFWARENVKGPRATTTAMLVRPNVMTITGPDGGRTTTVVTPQGATVVAGAAGMLIPPVMVATSPGGVLAPGAMRV